MKIKFAHITIIADFPTKESAEKYIKENQGKHWWFSEIRDTGEDEFKYSIEIRKPYRNYDMGC